MFWVYILKCSDGSYYTGHTDDLEKRISQHTNKFFAECYTASSLFALRDALRAPQGKRVYLCSVGADSLFALRDALRAPQGKRVYLCSVAAEVRSCIFPHRQINIFWHIVFIMFC